jgi:Tfp pilus assembly protein PilN
MKNRVNLFTDEFKPKRILITLGFAGVIWSVAAMVIAISTFFAYSTWRTSADAAEPFASSYDEKQSMIRVLTDARDNRLNDETLMLQIDTLQKQLRARVLLINELEKKEQLKNQGFSSLLHDLAANHQDGVWLKRIRVSEQQLQLMGGTANAAAVPHWIKNLKQADYFTGKKFAGATMYRDELDVLQFEIGAQLTPLINGAETNE